MFVQELSRSKTNILDSLLRGVAKKKRRKKRETTDELIRNYVSKYRHRLRQHPKILTSSSARPALWRWRKRVGTVFAGLKGEGGGGGDCGGRGVGVGGKGRDRGQN